LERGREKKRMGGALPAPSITSMISGRVGVWVKGVGKEAVQLATRELGKKNGLPRVKREVVKRGRRES